MIQPRNVRYGSLDSYVIDAGGPDSPPPKGLVLLCHGYGAPGSDMVGIVGEWIHLLGSDAADYRFICPIAPESLAELGMPSGRAWWPLNMSRLMEAIEAKRFDEMHQETPPGLDEARTALSELINEALAEMATATGAKPEDVPLAIGGFSQGAMLTMDTALRGSIPTPDLLIQFSGTLIAQAKWTTALSRLQSTQVYQSHGMIDPILPFSSAERLRDLVSTGGVEVQFHSFMGPHTIDPESLATTAQMIQNLLK